MIMESKLIYKVTGKWLRCLPVAGCIFGTGCLLLAGLSSCRAPQTGTLTVSPAATTLMPGKNNQAHLEVSFQIPENYLTRRSRLVITPQFCVGDSVCREYTPVVLDASVYRKKVERLEVLDGYQDPYAQEARLIDNRMAYEIPYDQWIDLPEQVNGGQIRAVVSTDGCGECTGTDTLMLAEITDPMRLFDPEMRLVNLKADWVVRPKIREGEGKANLQFAMNSHAIEMDRGNNAAEMRKMMETLQPILDDSLSVLDRLTITGLASADGSLAFNTKLSRERAEAARSWLVEELRIPAEIQRRIAVSSRPEGWMPVLDAMRRAGDKDTVALVRILEKYAGQSDDVQEYHIRRLPEWNRIKDLYLQKDRVVAYQYAYTVKSFTTDEQMLSLYRNRPDAFSEAELLRVSTLMNTDDERKWVYRKVLQYYPASQTAANNLAMIYLQQGQVAEAQEVLDALTGVTSPVILNTLAVAWYQNGRTNDAMDLLQAHLSLPESRHNLGVMKALAGELEEAYQLLAPFADVDAVIMALRTGRKKEARRMLEALPADSKEVERLREML